MSSNTFILYEYKPLESSNNEIRVIKILPIIDTDRLECRLEHIPLNDPQGYDALSYAWHDPTLFPEGKKDESHVLILNGKGLYIGSNLASFIQSARTSQGESHWIWIDAVCINQQDETERNKQVLRMGEIYQKANQVVVWLGPEANHSEIAVEFLKFVSVECPRGREAEWIKAFMKNNSLALEWNSVTHFLARAWWNRIWIVQEVVLAKEICVLCGTSSMAWMELEYSLYYISNMVDEIKNHVQESGDLASISDRVRRVNRLIATRRHKDNLTAVHVFDDIGANDCTNKSDKIYGVLGIIPDAHLIAPAPSYSLDVEEVHRRAFGSLAVTFQNLDFLSLVVNRPRKSDGGGFPASFPSWCPDMTSNYFKNIHRLNPFLHLPPHSEPQFCASGTRLATVTLATDAKTIRLSGIRIDIVDGVFPGGSGFRYNLALTSQARSGRTAYASEKQSYEALWRSFVAGLNIYNISEGSYEAPARFGDLFARQCCIAERQHQRLVAEGTEMPFDIANLTSDGSKFIAEDLAWPFNTWYKYNRDALFAGRSVKSWAEKYNPEQDEIEGGIPLDQLPIWKEFACSWAPANFGRRMITTEKGYVGLALELSKRGYLICILFGFRMPVVLRHEGKQFKFMGECYIHGLMFGEAIEELDKGLYEVEEFELI